MKLLAILYAAGCLVSRGMAQQPVAASPETAVVQVKVNRTYDDSEESLRLIGTLAQYAPSRQIQVVAGDTLSQLFVSTYGFGVSDLPKSYALLERVILAKNNLTRPQDLHPGTLNVPAIPKRVNMGFGKDNPYNYIANMTLWDAGSARPAAAGANRSPVREGGLVTESAASAIAFSAPVALHEPNENAPFEVMKFELPVKAADDLEESPDFPAGTFKGVSRQIPVKLALESKCDTEPADRDTPTLTAEQRSAISRLLTDHARRAPIIFILDTGWPSRAAYEESRAAIYEVLTAVWLNRFGIQFPMSAPERTTPEANHEHCRCIERALRELRELDKNQGVGKRIRVAYVPLTREQGAHTILLDLLQTADLLQRQVAANGRFTRGRIGESRSWAGAFVRRYFQDRWVGEEVRTDKAILDAILAIGQVYAEARQTVFFANESWTVDHRGKYKVFYEAPEYGIVASAAGNDGTTNLQDFAQRSVSTKDTIAVLNMTAAGVASDSSRILPSNIDEAMALGFDGSITDDIHGTSFSAPRVAWFLAAGEAIREKPLNLDQWAIELQVQLKALRNPQATGYLKLLFDPVRYLKTMVSASRTSN